MGVNFTNSITVTRRGSGSYDTDGNWTEGDSDEITISGNVQALNPGSQSDREMINALGTQFLDGYIKIYSDDELKTADKAGTRPDIVSWNGNTYEVKSVQYRWMLQYYKAVACLIDEKPNDAAA